MRRQLAALGHKSIREFNGEGLMAVMIEVSAAASVKLAGIEDYVLPQWKGSGLSKNNPSVTVKRRFISLLRDAWKEASHGTRGV